MTIPFSDRLGGFDDSELREFMASHEVRRMEPHFFVKDGVPHWSVLFCYDPVEGETVNRQRKERQNWRDVVPAKDWGLFNALRDWRNERGRQGGLPPYLVFTNRQLAEMVERAPDTLAALSEIDGVGPRRIEKYGKAVLDIIGQHRKEDGGVDEAERDATSADVLDRVPRLAADDDGSLSQEGALHLDEQD